MHCHKNSLPVLHDRGEVIRSPQVVRLLLFESKFKIYTRIQSRGKPLRIIFTQTCEPIAAFLCELTGFNVVKEDPDVAVSVGPDLLMVEAKSMKNFMLHNFIVHAACFLQGQVLSPILTAHIGPAPKM